METNCIVIVHLCAAKIENARVKNCWYQDLCDKDMRTRLASLIVVKQEPISNDYLDSEQNGIYNYNDVESQFYSLSDRQSFFQSTNGDLNNNDQAEFADDKKCMYFSPEKETKKNQLISFSLWFLPLLNIF